MNVKVKDTVNVKAQARVWVNINDRAEFLTTD